MSLTLEFLGTGGATATPRVGSQTTASKEARLHKSPPYTRTGPGLFLHGPDILFDTTEEVRLQLEASNITHINSCFYSHWHPDHTAGMRIFEMNGWDQNSYPMKMRPATNIYLPEQVAADFKHRLALWDTLRYLEKQGCVQNHVLKNGESVSLGKLLIKPIPLHETYVYAFHVTHPGGTLLLALDELYGWAPPPEVRHVDIAVLASGIFDVNYLTGAIIVDPAHPVLKREATFAETVDMARVINAKTTYFTHIEEVFDLPVDHLNQVETVLREDGLNATFAYDTLRIDLLA